MGLGAFQGEENEIPFDPFRVGACSSDQGRGSPLLYRNPLISEFSKQFSKIFHWYETWRTVKNSEISEWWRKGIEVQGGSITANIHDNTLVGPGDVLVGAAVPNGILFIHGAGGNVTDNTINAMHHSLSGSRSAGILFFDPVAPGIVVEGNNISDTDDGVNISANANDVIIRNNNLHDNLEVGIHLEDGATNTSITGNTISGNPMGGIRFAGAADPGTPDDPPSTGNVANRNSITGNTIGVAGYDTQVFDAECNWWGDASGPSGAGPGTGDSAVGNVDFEPWLTTSDLVSGPCNGPLLGATLTLLKIVDNTGGGTELDTAWTLIATGTATISGIEGNASITNAVVPPGVYNLGESGPAGYTPSSWVCTGGTQNDFDTVTIADGDDVTCTITNTFFAAPLPPPANACDTPTIVPAGYTLVEGTTGSDNVTIIPFTMFVGKGGNDNVKGPADGNYIVCTGTGNDIITLGNGDFTISAGTGSNSITTGNGDGYISSGTASDKITTGNGVQTIEADGGNNTVLTGNGDKTITTGTGNDIVTTGSGADVVNAGGGTNNVSSGAGNDNVTTGTGNDTINGGADADTCDAGGGINSVSNCAP